MQKARLLFTPGPLTTSEAVKWAMMRDLGSRDAEFLEIVRKIRRRLLELGNVADSDYEAVLMQGSGTFAIESVISSVLPRDGNLLVLINGAYGQRMAKIARALGIATETLVFPESCPVDPAEAPEFRGGGAYGCRDEGEGRLQLVGEMAYRPVLGLVHRPEVVVEA